MSTTPRTEPRTTRTVRIRGRRLGAAATLAVVAPLTLAACGVIGGGTNHGDAPVEISQDAGGGGATSANGGNQAPATGVDPGSNGGAVTATQATTQIVVSGGATVTRIGVRTVVNTQIRTQIQVNTQINTQFKTQVSTKVSTAAPVTNTVTETKTVTENKTVTETKTVTSTVTVKAAAAAAGG